MASKGNDMIVSTKPQPFEESRGLELEPAGQENAQSVSKTFSDQLMVMLRKTFAFDCKRTPFATASKDKQFYRVTSGHRGSRGS